MNLNQYSISSAQPGLSVERIENLLIPIPPIEEQKRIGEYIGVKGKTIELAINELLSQIEDLKSYKSSVITEAVTGKVDLREWNKQIVTA
jgi:type I restriction enzyme S subunit